MKAPPPVQPVSETEAQDIRKQLATIETDLRRIERPATGLAILHDQPEERLPGAIDPTSGALVGGRGREDVFDGLVTLVLRHGGEVLVADRIPSGDSLAAELH